MSPARATALTLQLSFPRVSGDEPPAKKSTPKKAEFSPRERG